MKKYVLFLRSGEAAFAVTLALLAVFGFAARLLATDCNSRRLSDDRACPATGTAACSTLTLEQCSGSSTYIFAGDFACQPNLPEGTWDCRDEIDRNGFAVTMPCTQAFFCVVQTGNVCAKGKASGPATTKPKKSELSCVQPNSNYISTTTLP